MIVYAFVERQTYNPRKSLKAKAESFLKKWGQ
jgi:hypothetical protein